MTDNHARIGFCCKWMDPDRTKKRKDLLLSEQPMNQSHTTLAKLSTMTPLDQYTKIQSIVRHNTATLWRQLRWIAEQPCAMRLFRVGSGFLPASTVPEYDHVLKDPAFLKDLSDGLAGVRDFADANSIRLCMHPGQFTNLCSDKDEVVARSIEDLEYHADLARFMGYGDTWHSSGFAINIHANSRQDPGLVRIRDLISTKLSPEARNLITLENDEFGCSVDDFVNADVHKDIALVLDIHHHWVESQGEYILPSDPRAEKFRESWRGQRPLGHYSLPQPEILNNHCLLTPPDFATLGLKQGKVRSHSDLCWNSGSNDWALSHLAFMDIEVEAKHKNLASRQLYDQAVLRGIVA